MEPDRIELAARFMAARIARGEIYSKRFMGSNDIDDQGYARKCCAADSVADADALIAELSKPQERTEPAGIDEIGARR